MYPDATVRNALEQEFVLADVVGELRERYGVFMTTEEVAAALKMSAAALRMARSRKQLELRPLEIEGRRNRIYRTSDVARLMTSWMTKRAEDPM